MNEYINNEEIEKEKLHTRGLFLSEHCKDAIKICMLKMHIYKIMGFPSGSVVKNPPANAGTTGHVDLILVSRRSPGGGNGNPVQYSCLENPKDRGAWRAAVHWVMKNQT